MKKYIKIIIIFICVLFAAGCGDISKAEQNKILKELKNEKIIEKGWKQIDSYYTSDYVGEAGRVTGYGYIYEDSNKNMYEIFIKTPSKDNTSKEKTTYLIDKHKVVSIKDDISKCPNYGCTGETYHFSDEISSSENKYILSNDEHFSVVKTNKKFLFITFKKYTVEKN